MSLTRRNFTLSGGAAATFAGAAQAHNAATLKPVTSRQLAPRFGGFNSPVMWDIPYEDPRLRPAVAGMKPALLRFPGGTIANYWNPKSGRVQVGEDMLGNFALGARRAPELHPQGATYEDFARFAKALGCELVLVLNLETSTLDEQMAWVKQIKSAGLAPTRIEMGNEFYLEPLTAGAAGRKARTPSQTYALEVSERFTNALRPIVGDVRIAVQSSGSRFNPEADPLLAEFDDQLVAAPWFQAVAWHIYPEIAETMGVADLRALGGVRRDLPERFRSAGFLGEADAEIALTALLARVEEGTRRQAAFLRSKAPGKEVWVTEWGTGENVAYYRGERPCVTGMWIHVLGRQLMGLLREPNVTMALNHSLYMDGLCWSPIRRVDDEREYAPIGAYDVFRWFNDATSATDSAPVRLTEFTIPDVEPLRGGGPANERYFPVLALGFEKGARRTLIVHNSTAQPRSMDLSALGAPAKSAESLATPKLTETFSHHKPAITALQVRGSSLLLPPRSFVRVQA